MKFLVLSFLVFFNLNNDITHDSVKATFNVIEKGHVLMLEIDFNTQNFLKVHHPESNTISKDVFTEYLNSTTSWEIDGVKLVPNVLSVKPNGHHTKIICFLSKAPQSTIKTIKIKNKFLIDIASHINIIEIDVNKKFRDFRMDKDKQELSIEY